MTKKIIILDKGSEFQICRGEMIIYKIPVDSIDQSVQPGNISKHIVHLIKNYKLSDPDFLYKLAKLIEQKIPDHEINWLGTFTIVEQHFHNIRMVAALHRKRGGPVKIYHAKHLGTIRKVSSQEDRPEIRKKMRDFAEVFLLKYGIPVKSNHVKQSKNE